MPGGIGLDPVSHLWATTALKKRPVLFARGWTREILADQAVAPLFAALSLRIWLAAFFSSSSRSCAATSSSSAGATSPRNRSGFSKNGHRGIERILPIREREWDLFGTARADVEVDAYTEEVEA